MFQCDNVEAREVSQDEIEELCKEHDFMGWTETSAKEGMMIEESMGFVVSYLSSFVFHVVQFHFFQFCLYCYTIFLNSYSLISLCDRMFLMPFFTFFKISSSLSLFCILSLSSTELAQGFYYLSFLVIC